MEAPKIIRPSLRRISRGLIRDSADASMGMLLGDRSYAIDANLILADGAAAQVASGYAQANGADGVIDFGGNQGTVPIEQARIEGMLVIYIDAITTTGSSLYTMTLCGSNNPTFGAGLVQNLASMDFGNALARLGLNALTTAAPGGAGAYPAGSMYELPFCTEQNNIKYEYVKLYVAVTGSIQFSAFVAVTPQGG